MKGWTSALYNKPAAATPQRSLERSRVRISLFGFHASAAQGALGTQCSFPGSPVRQERLSEVTFSLAVVKTMNKITEASGRGPGCCAGSPKVGRPLNSGNRRSRALSLRSPSPAPGIHRHWTHRCKLAKVNFHGAQKRGTSDLQKIPSVGKLIRKWKRSSRKRFSPGDARPAGFPFGFCSYRAGWTRAGHWGSLTSAPLTPKR